MDPVALARALIEVHGRRERTRALELAEIALADFEAAGRERDARSARAWLADHSR